MTAFADSSALVKIYADEPGHEQVRDEPVLVVSVLARVEVASALWRKERTGELSHDDAALLVGEFSLDWHELTSRFVPVEVTGQVLDVAVLLAARHGLRAYDAVQLGSALAARDAGVALSGFLSADRALARAAVREGLSAPSVG